MSSWDQRIPNEPLFERQFFVQQPPIIPQDGPMSTTQCLPADYYGRPWLLMSKNVESDMMNYWRTHTACPLDGINTKCNSKKRNKCECERKGLDQMIAKYPDRPWLRGIRKNTDQESLLFGQHNLASKDCITRSDRKKLQKDNRLADTVMLRSMVHGQLFRNGALCDGRLWNQSTSLRANEPFS